MIPVQSSKSVSNSKVEELKKAMNKDGYSKLKVDKKLTSSMKSAMKKDHDSNRKKRTGRKICPENGGSQTGWCLRI